jgi:hypothetical protein
VALAWASAWTLTAPRRPVCLGGEADFLRGGFGLADADVAAGGGESGLAIGLGVGRLADVYLELLLLLLRLQLGDARLLLDDGLASLGLGERTLLAGLLLGRSISAWKPAFLISVPRIDSAICAWASAPGRRPSGRPGRGRCGRSARLRPGAARPGSRCSWTGW